MAKNAYQLFREGKDPNEIGNPRLRQQVRRLQQQNYQQQLNQVNANYQAWRAENEGVPIADYFAQVNAQKQPYTVKDGDTLSTIAANTGSTVPGILNANPDMTAPKTGMVLNAPASDYKTAAFTPPTATGGGGAGLANLSQPSTPSMYLGQGVSLGPGGAGLPSNAALGATTTNPQGINPTTTTWQARLQALEKSGRNQPPSPLAGVGQAVSDWWRGLVSPITKPSQKVLERYGQTPGAGVATPSASATNQPSLIGGLPSAAGISKQNLINSALRLMEKVSDPKYTPTPAELQALARHRLIKRSSPKAYGGLTGNYSYGALQNLRRGYGGGGGGPQSGGGGTQYAQRYNPDYNASAFSGGGGMRGLINWRI